MQSLLTVNEVAQILRVSQCTIYRMAHEGFLPSVKVGHSLRFREKDIRIWLAKRTNPGRKKRKVEV